MTDMRAPVTMLGLGAMGRALAAALVDAGRDVTVWNRTPGKAGALVERGAVEAAGVRDAVSAGGPVVVCLYDHASVRETLDPVAAELRGRAVVNLTTTTPDEARELAKWADGHGIDYLDGAIMATPPMIGAPGAQILYSGSREVFDGHRALFEVWAACVYDGADAGTASLFDLAILAGMYPLFAGFLQGAATVRAAGGTAAEFAERAAPFLAAMTGSFSHIARTVDGGDYGDPVQSLDWTVAALDAIGRATREQGVEPVPTDMVGALVRAQTEAGRGAEDFYRIVEGMAGDRK
ncbi:NAD(P)-dependent oxidoreductase [Actinomadura algeriensis]|uniref:3-hydroxyisobutyrate dehydrogenase-like beta-hydroxyacid dehydrogenase n=1 Tax=Actinomadura algeriensis TaxID=1679523 RepID=A0ABR9JU50_9ACTN|nr:NAD(P)-binding domain-containing protein [Actinomadura algeriensis]MBE1533928.1 3-hydroxyisobutyrate dehydrogenase-like beta-hydroxyacid dehydrogenase [Actinomadura algeriensis]